MRFIEIDLRAAALVMTIFVCAALAQTPKTAAANASAITKLELIPPAKIKAQIVHKKIPPKGPLFGQHKSS